MRLSMKGSAILRGVELAGALRGVLAPLARMLADQPGRDARREFHKALSLVTSTLTSARAKEADVLRAVERELEDECIGAVFGEGRKRRRESWTREVAEAIRRRDAARERRAARIREAMGEGVRAYADHARPSSTPPE